MVPGQGLGRTSETLEIDDRGAVHERSASADDRCARREDGRQRGDDDGDEDKEEEKAEAVVVWCGGKEASAPTKVCVCVEAEKEGGNCRPGEKQSSCSTTSLPKAGHRDTSPLWMLLGPNSLASGLYPWMYRWFVMHLGIWAAITPVQPRGKNAPNNDSGSFSGRGRMAPIAFRA